MESKDSDKLQREQENLITIESPSINRLMIYEMTERKFLERQKVKLDNYVDQRQI